VNGRVFAEPHKASGLNLQGTTQMSGEDHADADAEVQLVGAR
jgi:hypothetical protein